MSLTKRAKKMARRVGRRLGVTEGTAADADRLLADKLGLGPNKIYPSGALLAPAFFHDDALAMVDLDTPIASIGSCFARNLKIWLEENGFNYLITSGLPNTEHGSAGWDRVYNTFCLKQEFERAFAKFEPADQTWTTRDGRLCDPYRKDIVWDDLAHRQRELAQHRLDARRALTECELLVITIGVNEIWYSREDGAVFYQIPHPSQFDEARHAFRRVTVSENIANLARCHALVIEANPELQILLTVSPVPLRATFGEDDCVSANAESKATLLVAAKQFARQHENVHYFPSYELVTLAIPDAFVADNRHVRPEGITAVMEVFRQRFVRD